MRTVRRSTPRRSDRRQPGRQPGLAGVRRRAGRRLSPSGRRRRRRVAPRPARPSAAPGPGLARSRGTITAPASTRSCPGPYAGADPPPGTRVDTATATPRAQARRTAVDHRGAGVARTHRLQHEPARAGGDERVDRRRRRRPGRPRRCRPGARRAARPEVGPLLGAGRRRTRRRRPRPPPACRRTVPVRPASCRPSGARPCRRSTTSTPRPRACGLAATASASRRLAGPSASAASAAAHRAGQHHRHVAVVGQVQPQRGLLHGVGAVGDHHAVGAGRPHRGDRRARSAVPVGGRRAGSCPPSSGRRPRRPAGPAARSAPLRVGRSTPSASVLVAMVPPVVIDDEAGHAASSCTGRGSAA